MSTSKYFSVNTSKIFSVKKGFAAILILGAVLAVLVLGATVYLKQTQKPWNLPNQVTVPDKTTKPSPSPTTQSDETANWKMYRNAEFGYEVKYPQHLTPKTEEPEIVSDLELLSRVNFFKEDSEDPVLHIDVSTNELTVEVEQIKRAALGHAADEVGREIRITKEEYEGVRLEFVLRGPEPKTFPVMIINNKRYSFIIGAPADLIDQIFSTFKFTN